MLACGDDTLYTGYTTDIERRVTEHRNGEGAKYTRGRDPIHLVHVEHFGTLSDALRREYEIKQLPRSRKLALIDP